MNGVMAPLTSSISHQYNSYEEPLQFDIAILHLVLQRNRNQHFRALYFRRLEMVLRSITRYSILGSSTEGNLGLCEVMSFLQGEHARIISIVNRQKAKQRRYNHERDENHKWTIQSNSDAVTYGNQPYPQSLIIKYTKRLHEFVTQQIPEILSRISHAASALYIELSRGYFVPFCTVSLACISRVRMLLMHLAKEGCVQYQIMISFLQRDYLSYVQSDDCHENQDGSSRGGKFLYSEAKEVLNCHAYQLIHVENTMKDHYKEIEEGEFNSIMNGRLLSELRRRCEILSGKNNESGNKCTQKSSSGEKLQNEQIGKVQGDVIAIAIEDIIGERIDFSSSKAGCDLADKHDDEKEKESGDNNLEIIKLLKEQGRGNNSKVEKKKRFRDASYQHSLTSANEEMQKGQSKNGKGVVDYDTVTKKKAENKVVKKKKKKRKKDVIDDIFDGL